MKEQFDLVIDGDGSIEAIYQDGLAEALGAKTAEVTRASNVEWEKSKDGEGWTVRSATDPKLAICRDENDQLVVSRDAPIYYFATREKALEWEVKFFWDIIKKET